MMTVNTSCTVHTTCTKTELATMMGGAKRIGVAECNYQQRISM